MADIFYTSSFLLKLEFRVPDFDGQSDLLPDISGGELLFLLLDSFD